MINCVFENLNSLINDYIHLNKYKINNFLYNLTSIGQVVTNEIVMASESGCPIEMHKIEIEKCDEMYDRECRGDKYIPFHRAAYDRETGQSPNAPREQVCNRTTNSIKLFKL